METFSRAPVVAAAAAAGGEVPTFPAAKRREFIPQSSNTSNANNLASTEKNYEEFPALESFPGFDWDEDTECDDMDNTNAELLWIPEAQAIHEPTPVPIFRMSRQNDQQHESVQKLINQEYKQCPLQRQQRYAEHEYCQPGQIQEQFKLLQKRQEEMTRQQQQVPPQFATATWQSLEDSQKINAAASELSNLAFDLDFFECDSQDNKFCG
jgi:hypothetical protein